MKLISYRYKDRACCGWVDNDQVHSLSSAGTASMTLKQYLEQHPNGLSDLPGKPDHSVPLSDVEFMAVIPDPGKIICVGLNYHAHRIETGRDENKYPTLFTRFAASLAAHEQEAWLPNVSDKMDFEGELAVIIGKPGHRIRKQNALDHVAGYSCFNDISIRDWQRHSSQFTPGKNFQRTGPFGPWMVTADEIGDPSELTLVTRLNGQVMQKTETNLMIFDIPTLLEYISTFTVLEAGDVIATGTPGGVGFKREPPVYMRDGDQVEVEISRIGTLKNSIVKAPSS